MLGGIKRSPRLGQHRRHKPGELGDEDRRRHGKTPQEILRSNRRVDLRVSFLGAFVPWTRATLCFKASMRLITCGPSEAGAATISLPATLASINCCSLREYRSGYLSRAKSPVEALTRVLAIFSSSGATPALGASWAKAAGWVTWCR